MRGAGLGEALSDTDPQKIGVPPLPVQALAADSERAARLANRFIDGRGRAAGRRRHPANMIMLRGFARFPTVPSYAERVRAARGRHRGERHVPRGRQAGRDARSWTSRA